MVEWSIEALRAAPSVRSIVVACPPGYAHELGGEDLAVVDGGEIRPASVFNGLAAVSTELVAIHDAARPLVTAQLVEGVIETLAADDGAAGAIAATPVTDTIKRVAAEPSPSPGAGGEGADSAAASAGAGGEDPDSAAAFAGAGTRPPSFIHSVEKGGRVIESTVDRAQLWAAQTPQVFRTEALRRALEVDPGRAAAATDEAMLVEADGGRVLIHPAPPENLKVTTPLDLRLAELLLSGNG